MDVVILRIEKELGAYSLHRLQQHNCRHRRMTNRCSIVHVIRYKSCLPTLPMMFMLLVFILSTLRRLCVAIDVSKILQHEHECPSAGSGLTTTWWNQPHHDQLKIICNWGTHPMIQEYRRILEFAQHASRWSINDPLQLASIFATSFEVVSSALSPFYHCAYP